MPNVPATAWYLSPFVIIAGLLLTAAILGFLLKKKK
jgi:LPXTG-motif cell wall-anchored protein